MAWVSRLFVGVSFDFFRLLAYYRFTAQNVQFFEWVMGFCLLSICLEIQVLILQKKLLDVNIVFFEELIRLTTLSDAYFFSVYWNFPGFFFFPRYPLEQTNQNQQPTSSSWW